ncbi:MAG: methionyl-tRNA formyltransferase [Lentisphaeraceae bacterium]|nr:methionyl-tRNA formyltransferase [Lentisphaeraceae bacterium]
MTANKTKVFFLGSGDIAVPSLRALHENDAIELVGVGTQPDKKAGRGNKLTATPVGKAADDLSLAPWKIDNINQEKYVDRLKDLCPDFILVIAFGQLLKEVILNLPKLACVNVHASILPDYRGASPINSCLLNGDTVTGVSIMQMEKGLDTGPVYEIITQNISEDDNALTLKAKLAKLAGENIVSALDKISSGSVSAETQNHEKANHCSKIAKNDALISWDMSAQEINNRVKAYFPWPGTFTFFETNKGPRRLVVTKAALSDLTDKNEAPGTVLPGDKKKLFVKCGDDSVLELLQVKPEGKGIMNAADFLCGGQIKAGSTLTQNLTNLAS